MIITFRNLHFTYKLPKLLLNKQDFLASEEICLMDAPELLPAGSMLGFPEFSEPSFILREQ